MQSILHPNVLMHTRSSLVYQGLLLFNAYPPLSILIKSLCTGPVCTGDGEPNSRLGEGQFISAPSLLRKKLPGNCGLRTSDIPRCPP